MLQASAKLAFLIRTHADPTLHVLRFIRLRTPLVQTQAARLSPRVRLDSFSTRKAPIQINKSANPARKLAILFVQPTYVRATSTTLTPKLTPASPFPTAPSALITSPRPVVTVKVR